MRTLRSTIGSREGTLVLFELPNMQRVLDEAAFWDIYYEHCSYFTTGSLARLFRSTGFKLLELDLEYDNQYIVLAAVAADRSEGATYPREDDLPTTTAAVAIFQARFSEVRRHWLSVISDRRAAGQKIVVWGGGSKAVSFLTTLGLTNEIELVVDINPHKHGKFVPGTGHAVIGPNALPKHHPDCVILMNPVYEKEVREILQGLKISPDILPL